MSYILIYIYFMLHILHLHFDLHITQQNMMMTKSWALQQLALISTGLVTTTLSEGNTSKLKLMLLKKTNMKKTK